MSALHTQPDVSFIIAAYNSADTIVPAIESALTQQGVSLEVIVVDDCSSDATREIVGALAESEPRVKLLALAQNLGPGGARNAGIDAAQGRWIAVLDSDDVIYQDRSARMIWRAEQANAQIAVDNLDVVYLDGRPKDTMFCQKFLTQKETLTLEEFIGSNILFKSTFNYGYMKPMFRRDFLNENGLRFRPDLRIGEDYLLLASALAKGGLCAIEPTPGYVYNIREGSISRVLELRHVDAMIAADRDFLTEFTLLPAAMDAQKARTRSLIEARHFLILVDSIKRRSPTGIINIALRDPRALRHLSMPIAVRLKKLREAIFPSQLPSQVKRQTS
ncbi:glycosyltransferase family 2 protein [Agrobacterium larrymoorei]|uniref:Glycosyltransferase family 2 protein n=1 Tax=Agrobacterium larrymoorei TaxID=160699 RepID=A0AAF0KJM4_9HYPH|nr:glycosyltransferase family 2 protein [Agrobacterium larrymoorei]WHA42779.1 glycosyltransferase family 2 protein [Agrobacterium larrymoorei]